MNLLGRGVQIRHCPRSLLSQLSPDVVSVLRHSDVHSGPQLRTDRNSLVHWVGPEAFENVFVDGSSVVYCGISLQN